MAPNVLELTHVSKAFGPVRAVDDVSLAVGQGEVVALVGDNGAGKSSLLKILSGVARPDTGSILIGGRNQTFGSPAEAERCGVHMVYQDLALIETVDVASNLFLGREVVRPGILGRLGVLDKKRMRRESAQHLQGLGSRMGSTRRPVEVLSGGQRQAVAIARAVARVDEGSNAVVLLDEPSAALGVEQARRVDELILRLRERGVSVFLVTHNLPQCFAVATRLIVMRHGSKVADIPTDSVDLDDVVGLITGARVRHLAGDRAEERSAQ